MRSNDTRNETPAPSTIPLRDGDRAFIIELVANGKSDYFAAVREDIFKSGQLTTEQYDLLLLHRGDHAIGTIQSGTKPNS